MRMFRGMFSWRDPSLRPQGEAHRFRIPRFGAERFRRIKARGSYIGLLPAYPDSVRGAGPRALVQIGTRGRFKWEGDVPLWSPAQVTDTSDCDFGYPNREDGARKTAPVLPITRSK